jgi:carboxypeptidase D
MNGGPGSDSILGLFDELGPCRITENLTTTLNPWSFSNVSNLLFLSQPVGVGFSYQDEVVGTLSNITGAVLTEADTPKDSVVPLGRYGALNPTGEHTIDTTDAAAIAGWDIVQGFISGIESLGGKAKKPKTFNLWAESYGGHWGPAFLDYFYEQNERIANGTVDGHALEFGTLGLVNPFVDAQIQDPWGPEFAINNNYGIVALDEATYNYTQLGINGPMGCATQIEVCKLAAQSVEGGYVDGFITAAAAADAGVNAQCGKAQNMCRDNVELPYVYLGQRGTYDIRRPALDPTPPPYLKPYLNQAEIQEAIGVSLNYSGASKIEIFNEFQRTGDWVFPNSLRHVEKLLSYGVRVALVFGDADYVCNWHGGESLGLAIKHERAAEYAAAGYQPLEYAGERYGDVKEHGNLSFVRVYDAGHLVPYYQRKWCKIFMKPNNRTNAPISASSIRTLQSHNPRTSPR